MWRDEDAFEEFWMAVELGWQAVADEGSTVTHENADPGGAPTLRYGQLY